MCWPFVADANPINAVQTTAAVCNQTQEARPASVKKIKVGWSVASLALRDLRHDNSDVLAGRK
jgi:hypothetical protein